MKRVVLTEYNEELHLKNVRECGYEEGRIHIREQMESVIKKVRKGQSLEQIADALEKPENQLKEAYDAVVKAAPDYDVEKIWEELKSKK